MKRLLPLTFLALLGNAALVVLLLGVPPPLVDLDSDDDERFRLSATPAVLGTLLLSPDVDLIDLHPVVGVVVLQAEGRQPLAPRGVHSCA